MAHGTPDTDIDENDVEIHHQKHAAAGVTAVAVSMKRALQQMGPVRTAKTLLKLNQTDGFDCMSCAWPDPDPDHRHTAEFCENGAKAVAEEATKARVDPAFFARHSVAELAEKTEYWLGKAASPSRCTCPRAPTGTRRSPGSGPSRSSPRS